MERKYNETDGEYLQRFQQEHQQPDIYVIFVEGYEQYVERFIYWTFSEKEAQEICGKHPDLCYDVVSGKMEKTNKKVYSRRTFGTPFGFVKETKTKQLVPYMELLKALDPDEPDYVLADSLEEAEKLLNNRGKENDA